MTRARDLANFVNGIDASKITSGTFADARIAASNVSQHAQSFDDNKIVNDISTLAIRQASNENKAAYNTNSMYVDVFQDATGITGLTNAARNSSEYISTRVSSVAAQTQRGDGTDIVLIQAFGMSNGDTNFTDDSSNGVGTTSLVVNGGTVASDNANLPGNATSVFFDGSSDKIYNSTNSPSSSAFSGLGGETNIAISFWIYKISSPQNAYASNGVSCLDIGQEIQFEFDGSEKLTVYYRNVTVREQTPMSTNAWHHVAWQKQGGTARLYIDGVQVDSGAPGGGITSGNLTDNTLRWGAHRSAGNRYFDGFMDILRVSAVNAFPDGTSFASSLPDYGSETFSATGSFENNAITAPSSVSSMGAIITYENTSGTNNLNTDIVLKLSADNGSNYSTATLTAMPDFATGIKMAKVNDLSVTAGTQLKYKLEFANQASGSKEARIRGVSLQY
tara:strand:+ start:183 stop:1526 length:1344 start_codon:yes stop_codon:yes gene_type:complete